MELYQLPMFKKENIFRYIVFAIITVAAIAIIRYYVTPEPVDTESNKNVSIFIQNAIAEIDLALKKDSSDEDMTTRLSWLKSTAALYHDAKNNKNKDIKAQSDVLKTSLIKVQTREFPRLKTAFTNSKKEILAKENIQINNSGESNDTLTFTGQFFESSKARKDFLKGINQIVKDLRFKKVVFKWSEKSGDFEEFRVKGKGDGEV